MANVKFNKPGAATKPRPVATQTAEVVQGEVVEPNSGVTTMAVTTVGAGAPPALPPPRAAFADDDSIDITDIQLPKLKLAQGVGDLGTIFDPGVLVLGDETPLLEKAPPRGKIPDGYVAEKVRIVVLGFRPTRWTEKTDGGEQGAMFNTEAEVYANGGTSNYAEKDEKPYFRPLCTALILVEKPAWLTADHDPAFPYVDNSTGKRYAVATWNLQGASHTASAKPLKTWRKLKQFRDGPEDKTTGAYRNRFIDVTVVFKTWGNNSAFVPVVSRPIDSTTPEVRAIAEEFIPTSA